MIPEQPNGMSLAYLGDAVIELMVRERLLESGIGDVGKLNVMSQKYVKATEQSKGAERLLPHLSEQETEIYKRGRNVNPANTPKSATKAEYLRATGFEALFGYLYLAKEDERLRRLFDIAYGDELPE